MAGKVLSQWLERYFPNGWKGTFPVGQKTMSERKRRKRRKWTQITAFVVPNASSCRSERGEESRPGKEKRFFASL
ncbi:hypothetical protein [Tannerella sp.]|uniref:hypothetical protein n=1 Tax=Tannerella sp. TaxID=2382127 RepID=UPI003FA2D398